MAEYTSLKSIFGEFFSRLKTYFKSRFMDLSGDIININDGEDLNDFKTPGTYKCTSGTRAATLKNCPYTSTNFKLIVSKNSNDVGILYGSQTIISGGTNGVIWHRGCNNNTWGEWSQLILSSGGSFTGDLLFQNADKSRNKAFLSFKSGDVNGDGLVMGDGALVIIGGGESANALWTNLGYAATTEKLVLGSDGNIELFTNCNTIGNRLQFTFTNAGRLTGPNATEFSASQITSGTNFFGGAASSSISWASFVSTLSGKSYGDHWRELIFDYAWAQNKIIKLPNGKDFDTDGFSSIKFRGRCASGKWDPICIELTQGFTASPNSYATGTRIVVFSTYDGTTTRRDEMKVYSS